MSLLIEVSGMLGGVLSEYAQKKGWGKLKAFSIVSFVFFVLFAAYVVIFPSEKGVFVGLCAGTLFGCFSGTVFVFFMFIHEKCKKV